MARPLAKPIRSAALALAMAALSACSYVLLPPNVQHVAPKSNSVAEADSKLETAATRRAAIEAEYAASEQVCYTKFFVNNCLDRAKEKRRSELAVVRAVEIEAEHFKRKEKADERDRQLAAAEKEDQARQAELAARPPRPEPIEETAPPPPKATKVNRDAARAAKVKRQAEKDAAAQAQRAENVRQFEEKRKESERRQAEREERRAKQAAESK
ncbi:hypothetical protein [Massilia cavernae]|uniref:Uncharacterized protein n=1 Tax=Massilia cavernae TaxID=2320864 RepID=A0A418Y715_9BURK|nr:hypothetical protein [Massilia cavernae]RJG25379.1 hypothetical protein D3872_02985 [Massilia cavernae]